MAEVMKLLKKGAKSSFPKIPNIEVERMAAETLAEFDSIKGMLANSKGASSYDAIYISKFIKERYNVAVTPKDIDHHYKKLGKGSPSNEAAAIVIGTFAFLSKLARYEIDNRR